MWPSQSLNDNFVDFQEVLKIKTYTTFVKRKKCFSFVVYDFVTVWSGVMVKIIFAKVSLKQK